MRKKIALIDIDNTLLDFDEYVKDTLKTGFREFGIGVYEPYMYDVFEEINGGLWRQIERGEIDFQTLSKRRFNDVFKALSIDFDGVTFEKYFRKKLFTSAIKVDGAEEMIANIKPFCVMCIASNGPVEQQLNRLSLAGFKESFDFFFLSEDIGYSKPSIKFFETAFSKLENALQRKIEKSEVIMIGDSETSDIKGGKDFGITTCKFFKHCSQKETLSPIASINSDESTDDIQLFATGELNTFRDFPRREIRKQGIELPTAADYAVTSLKEVPALSFFTEK